MTFNVVDSGRTSQYLGMLEHSFVASQPAKFDLDAEHAFRSEPEPFRPSSSSMDFSRASSSPAPTAPSLAPEGPASGPSLYQVNLPDWYAQYTACVRHFVDHAQHVPAVQSLAAYLNIRLPYQHPTNSVETAKPPVSARHYIRRLIATGNDTPAVLETFFGAGWLAGVGSICKQERLNYLFTAKSVGWASTKAAYDVLPDEHIPFLKPLAGASEEELRAAEDYWSDWMAMGDWMVGPRSPW